MRQADFPSKNFPFLEYYYKNSASASKNSKNYSSLTNCYCGQLKEETLRSMFFFTILPGTDYPLLDFFTDCTVK